MLFVVDDFVVVGTSRMMETELLHIDSVLLLSHMSLNALMLLLLLRYERATSPFLRTSFMCFSLAVVGVSLGKREFAVPENKLHL